MQARQQLGQHARILQPLPAGLAQLGEIHLLVAGPLLQELAELDALLRGHAAERVLGRLRPRIARRGVESSTRLGASDGRSSGRCRG